MEQVLVVGETLVDVVRRPDTEPRELPGGSAANAAVALARLEVPVLLATALGRDTRGERLAEHLAGEGVDWAGDPWSLERTATAVADVADDGSATYSFDIGWQLHPCTPPEVGLTLVCSLAPVLAPGDEQVLDLVARVGRRAAVAYDVNARPAVTGTGVHLLAAVQTMASLADLVKASDEDLDVLMPDLGTEEAAERLLAAGAGAVVVTCGADGALWVDRNRTVRSPGVPAAVADTIGAGDTFGAALLRVLLAEGAWRGRRPGPPHAPFDLDDAQVAAALAWAAEAAAVTVSRPGADPPRLTELPPLPLPGTTR